MDTGPLRALWNPRRAMAARQQSWVSCSQAPRPGSLVSGSGTSAPSTLAKRRSSKRGTRARPPHSSGRGPSARPDDIGVLVGQRLMGVESAVARAGERCVRAAPAVAEDGGAAGADLLLLVAGVMLLLGEIGLGADVDAPAREPGGE